MFQQHGRLDIAGRAFFYRVLATVVGFAVGVLLTKNLLVGAALSFIASLVVMIALVIPPTKKMTTLKPTFDFKQNYKAVGYHCTIVCWFILTNVRCWRSSLCAGRSE